MSYFGDSDDDNESYANSSVGGDSSDDDEPLNAPDKKNKKSLLTDDMENDDGGDGDGDENDNMNDTDDDGNDTDDLNMTDTDGDDDDFQYDEDDEEEEMKKESKKESSKKEKSKKDGKESKKGKSSIKKMLNLDDEAEDDEIYDNEEYLQKFNEDVTKNYILNNHTECVVHNYNEVLSMCQTIKDSNGIIIDDLHRTIPYLTKYERARILGVRAKQINSGATPFIKLEEGMIDGYIIAELELKEKKIPFIIRRPMPNGGSEYWYLKDLEDLSY